MARKVLYSSIIRATKSNVGVIAASLAYMDKDNNMTAGAFLGFIIKTRGAAECTAVRSDNFNMDAIERKPIGSFPTQAQAGEALKKLFDVDNPTQRGRQKKAKVEVNTDENADSGTDEETGDSTETTGTDDTGGKRLLTFEEAAEELCGSTKNPMASLKKRIARGAVKTWDDGETVWVELSPTQWVPEDELTK